MRKSGWMLPTIFRRNNLIWNQLISIWIILAMVIGVGIGAIFPSISIILDTFRVDTISLPIAVGLLLMMYPPLAKVSYEELSQVKKTWRMFGVSLFLNWVVGPMLMFFLAWLFLPDLPEYRIGLIMIGLARCIAMVLVWNLLADGDNNYCALLVALNSIFQILLYSFYAFFFVNVMSPWIFGSSSFIIDIPMMSIAKNVSIFLGIPFAGGIITRFYLVKKRGKQWYEERFIRKLSPLSIIGLLATIVLMFAMKGGDILALPFDAFRISLPLASYFLVMFFASFLISRALGFEYSKTVTLSFTAASNNFELAIAVTIGVFGITSGQAFAAIIGPLVEVPVLMMLVNLSSWLRKKMYNMP